MTTAETADLLGFGPPPADDTAATPPRRGSGQVDLLGMGFGGDENAAAGETAKKTEHYESPTAVASLQQDVAAVDLLSGAPEVDMLDDRAQDRTEEKKDRRNRPDNDDDQHSSDLCPRPCRHVQDQPQFDQR